MLFRSLLLLAFATAWVVPSASASAALPPQPLLTSSTPLLLAAGGFPSPVQAAGPGLCHGMMMGAAGFQEPTGPGDYCWAEFAAFSLAIVALAGADMAYALALASANPAAIFVAQCAWIVALAKVTEKEVAFLACWYGDAGRGGQGRKDNMT